MEGPLNKTIKNAHLSGVAFGYSQAGRILFMGLIFYLGTLSVQYFGYDFERVYLSINVIIWAQMGAGMSMSNIPSIQRAKASAKTVFEVMDEKSELDVREGSLAPIQEVKHGEIKFVNVNFSYPSRAQKVLDNLNMSIPATFKIALVGGSGCGKSTITNLLLRFYNIQSGQILIDGEDITKYNVQNLRRQIGFVMQEPILFNQSIKDNILYGEPGASNEDIRRVCEQANAL